MHERYRIHSDESQYVAPIYADGRYLLTMEGELIEIVPSGPKRRHRTRWWRAVRNGIAMTDWLATPKIVWLAIRRHL